MGRRFRRSRGPEDPLQLYLYPSCWRIISWIVPFTVVIGLALIVIFVLSPIENQKVGLMIGGAILLFYSIAFTVIISAKCCAIGSVKFYMLPCTMSQQELQQLKSKCQVKHDIIFGVQIQVVQPVILSPVQAISQLNLENQKKSILTTQPINSNMVISAVI
ncbi:Hypothetical_protein [Hexamita inflata]|uniref:Hypothetical_protein n=1 Tax=Hexamita inflata TaxID=28002 RepID=A0AA86N621_9EUKA|nr:Hypothetical protein HINF_LOCUS1150 [Hexamita inflata]CAI9919028.1 Hypothetical protein HINF_LOCUS6673 [Hexamita inflata]